MKKVVMFSASWCGPCKQSKPVFNEIAASRKDMEFQVVDIEENEDMTKDFNITGVPTFMIIEDNEEVKRLVGAANKSKLEAFITG